jgi:hypothetical protein
MRYPAAFALSAGTVSAALGFAVPAFAQCHDCITTNSNLVTPPSKVAAQQTLSSYAEIGAPSAIIAAISAAFNGPGFGSVAKLYELGPEHTGAAAGDDPRVVQGWFSLSGGNTDDTHPGIASKVSSTAQAIGVQTMLTPTFLTGISLTTDQSFGNLPALREDANAIGFSPYIGYAFAPNWNAFGSFGWNTLHTDLKSNVPGAGAGTFHGDRWFINGGVSGSYNLGAVVLSPLVSILYQEQSSDAYTDTGGARIPSATTTLGRASMGGTMTWSWGGVQPFVKLALEVDFDRSAVVNPLTGGPSNYSDVGGVAGAGLNFTLAPNVTGTVDASYDTIGRSNLTGWSSRGRVTIRF